MSYDQHHGHPPQGSGAALGLGIAGLVVGILALLFSFIPCLGALAVYPGAVAVVLAGVGLALSLKANKVSGISIAALCVSIVACGIGGYQYFVINQAAKELKKDVDKIGTELHKNLKEQQRRDRERKRQREEAEKKRKEEEAKRRAEREKLKSKTD